MLLAVKLALNPLSCCDCSLNPKAAAGDPCRGKTILVTDGTDGIGYEAAVRNPRMLQLLAKPYCCCSCSGKPVAMASP